MSAITSHSISGDKKLNLTPSSGARNAPCNFVHCTFRRLTSKIITQAHQGHITKIISIGSQYVFNINNTKTVIELHSDSEAVVNPLIVTASDVLQAIPPSYTA